MCWYIAFPIALTKKLLPPFQHLPIAVSRWISDHYDFTYLLLAGYFSDLEKQHLMRLMAKPSFYLHWRSKRLQFDSIPREIRRLDDLFYPWVVIPKDHYLYLDGNVYPVLFDAALCPVPNVLQALRQRLYCSFHAFRCWPCAIDCYNYLNGLAWSVSIVEGHQHVQIVVSLRLQGVQIFPCSFLPFLRYL